MNKTGTCKTLWAGAAFSALALLTGCQSMPGAGGTAESGSGVGDRLEKAFTQVLAGIAAQSKNPFEGTELQDIFRTHPITNREKPETFPRVAITIKSATAGVLQSVSVGSTSTLAESDCIVFSARLWRSETEDKRFDDMKLCGGGVYKIAKDVPLYQLATWGRREASFYPTTTGSQRTDGPNPPTTLFPTDPLAQHLWMDRFQNGLGFIAAIQMAMGHDWNDVYEKRLWIVSVPTR
jgi:hypothetical protein